VAVADIIVRNLQRLRLRYPKMRKQDLARFEEMRELLETEGPTHPAAEE